MNVQLDFLNKLKQINLDNSCRVCITGKSCLRDIHKTGIPKMIENCSSVKISANDGLPHKICSACFRMITKVSTFRKKIERNDRLMREYFGKKASEQERKDIINIALEDADLKNISQIDDSGALNVNIHSKQEDINILPECLPPLIPIASDEKIAVESLPRELPKDTPPLIPLKAVVDIETLANVVPELELKCYVCSEIFKDISELNKHKLSKCKPKKLQCNVCLKQFKEPKKLISHLKGHMVVKDHLCKICGKKYPNYSTFSIHMRSHTGERPFKCTICQKGFVRWANVRLHMKTHEESRPYVCDKCPKAFKVSSNLERHKRLHSGIEPYICKYCKKTYSQQENLKMHVLTKHTNERPFLCNICGKGFVNSTRLNRHMWIHNGIKPHQCRLCPKSYLNIIDLKNHESQHLGKNPDDFKNYSCDTCNKKFFHPCRLARHKQVHGKWSKCDICQKGLDSKESYKKHLRDEHGFDECEEEKFLVQFQEVEVESKDVLK